MLARLDDTRNAVENETSGEAFSADSHECVEEETVLEEYRFVVGSVDVVEYIETILREEMEELCNEFKNVSRLFFAIDEND